jgi:hypothetical protein
MNVLMLLADAHGRDQNGVPERPDGASSPCGADAPPTREQTLEAESLTDVQDDEDHEGYGFGM